ncbi:MAG: hypothetical protein WD873_02225 [Candidatus Hydrogenedentales bacterium]
MCASAVIIAPMDINLLSAILWGLFATGLLTIIMVGSQGLGWSRMSLPFLIGTAFSSKRRTAVIAGALFHFSAGCVFAILYALVFEQWNRVSIWLGLSLGLYHGLFMLVVVVSLLPAIHPRMAGKHHGPAPFPQLEPPGFLGIHYGLRTPLITMTAHLVYGATLGAFYQLNS